MFNYIALVSETNQIPNWQVQLVAAALQIQVSRDFTPIWGVDATVSAFDQLADVPAGYWPIIIRDDIGFDDAAGIHLDRNKKTIWFSPNLKPMDYHCQPRSARNSSRPDGQSNA